MHRRLVAGLFCILLALGCASDAWAVIRYSTPTRNTDPPGSLTNRTKWTSLPGGSDPRRLLNSGWQYQGMFNGFLGTPIAENYFITAKHIGGETNPSNSFSYRGVNYPITTNGAGGAQYFDSPVSDLRLWKINGSFPADSWAPLYKAAIDGSELGKSLVVFGRGTQRGNPIYSNGELSGWGWGADDRVVSWGENTISRIGSLGYLNDQQLLGFDFTPNAGVNEAALTPGDSGGAMFIKSNGVWKLAGINYSVDGPFTYSASGSGFSGSIFNGDGLFGQFAAPSQFGPLPFGYAGYSWSTRISKNTTWIESITGPLNASPIPEPGALGIVMLAGLVLRRRSRNG
jgi:MYXO-CTERM domain-containing protein